jgi:hypothetical protein
VIAAIGEVLSGAAGHGYNYVQFNHIGKSIVTGIVAGIVTNTSMATGAIDKLTKQLDTRASLNIKEGSPSRVFMYHGEMISAGLAVGISNNEPLAVNAVSDMVGSVVNKATESLQNSPISTSMAEDFFGLADVLYNDTDYTPTVRPVLDTSSVENGYSRMSNMIDGGAYHIEGAQLSADVTSSFRDLDFDAINQRLDRVCQRLDQLSDTVAKQTGSIAERMGNQVMMLDTGALVAGIKDDMDRELGKNIALRRRRM